jgi:hypothetical protein
MQQFRFASCFSSPDRHTKTIHVGLISGHSTFGSDCKHVLPQKGVPKPTDVINVAVLRPATFAFGIAGSSATLGQSIRFASRTYRWTRLEASLCLWESSFLHFARTLVTSISKFMTRFGIEKSLHRTVTTFDFSRISQMLPCVKNVDRSPSIGITGASDVPVHEKLNPSNGHQIRKVNQYQLQPNAHF